MKADSQILMILWDAAEPRLIEKWSANGTLPNLARLRDRGAYGRLDSTADRLVGSPWPTFVTGALPHEHGVFHFLQWDPARMACVRPSPKGRPKPFWHALGEGGRRTVVLDLPMTFTPAPFSGVEVSGWATHDRFAKPASHPLGLLKQLRREFGPSFLAVEHYGQETSDSLLALRDELIASTAGITTIAEALVKREPWDVFIFALGATHRGGHKLWKPSRVVENIPTEHRAELDNGLRDVYVACDRAVGRLLAAAPEDSTVIVGSLHGMGPNTSRADVLPNMLQRILSSPGDSEPVCDDPGDSGESVPSSVLRRLLNRVPESWRLAVKHCLPLEMQDRITSRFFMGEIDWATARAFPVIADLHGYVQFNLRGREAAGIVDPGAELDRLCETLVEGLMSFVDADTKERVVLDAERTDRIFPEGDRRHELPDLLVRWTPSEASRHRAIVSPRYGEIAWPDPGGNPDGRSGNHRPQGFLIAAGEGIAADTEIRGHIRDLPATLFSRLGVERPSGLGGTVISGLSPFDLES